VPFFAFSYSIAEAALGLMLKFTDSGFSNNPIRPVKPSRSLGAVETQNKPRQPHEIVRSPDTGANDNDLTWPFIPFPEGWYGA
jgi:hypothetical protein